VNGAAARSWPCTRWRCLIIMYNQLESAAPCVCNIEHTLSVLHRATYTADYFSHRHACYAGDCFFPDFIKEMSQSHIFPSQLDSAKDRKAKKAATAAVEIAQERLARYTTRLAELAAAPKTPKIEVGALEEVCIWLSSYP